MKYTVAVRALCEFTAKRGDLDVRFTPSPTAQEGISGHALVAGRRGAGYVREIALSGDFEELRIRGRADGYDPARRLLEEFKTHRGDLARMPANHRALHWAQLKVYGALLCREKGIDAIELGLVYFDVSTQTETTFREPHSAESLEAFLTEHCRRFLQWARLEMAHRNARDASLDGLRFPHEDFRRGQRQLSESVYQTAGRGGALMMQASTGIGKTMATLFATLKAARRHSLDKVFFLSAKTSGREPALEALRTLRGEGTDLRLRTLELIARDKACEHPGKGCNGLECPLAKGFYDRLPAARGAALEEGAMTQGFLDARAVRETALRHDVCPYYLGQELVRWCDVVVCDYNYYFDSSALLFALTTAQDWRVALLVDEAHNLVERARQMYSVELTPRVFEAAKRAARASIKGTLHRIARVWRQCESHQTAPYAAYEEVPEEFSTALQGAVTAITDQMTTDGGTVDPDLQRFYFDAIAFGRLTDALAAHSLFDVTKIGAEEEDVAPGIAPRSTLTLRNVVPAPFLRPRFAAAHMSVLFSATLAPPSFYRDMLGLPAETAWLDVESPFDAAQLDVRIHRRISTRFRDRPGSISKIVDLMRAQYAQRPGNYLAFFSSFEYLRAVHDAFLLACTDTAAWLQTPNMREADRGRFLDRFTPGGTGIGFAVLGGPFAEGVDLPHDRLIGAFIATLGMPPLNPVNAELEKRMHALFGSGYEYTYLYPGLQRVVQAAGRVIRTPSDTGVVHLMDDRFSRREVRALLPRWWRTDDGAASAAPAASSPQYGASNARSRC